MSRGGLGEWQVKGRKHTGSHVEVLKARKRVCPSKSSLRDQLLEDGMSPGIHQADSQEALEKACPFFLSSY